MGGDLKLAARILHAEAQSLVVVRSGRVLFRSRMSGIEPLLEALDYDVLAGSAVADKVVGRAAAMVAVTGQAASVYSWIMGAGAVEVLTAAGILHCADAVVPVILDREGRLPCPLEAVTQFTVVPEKGVRALRHLLRDLQQGAKIMYMH
ncbi:MAG: DUF1893 domain-containing protein [Firmicutes bacterium]|nr:DUF1893 domain-containing protein [Bacillota bacterium]HOB35060.1 DUF1893 domain-containing protein [Bacillota bacterium]HPZ91459.1 DUF1893 domain-containing protein [Bacillota bacterium]HQE01276.1 DUF1893 domain-containing protein [Bacillota bacterium]